MRVVFHVGTESAGAYALQRALPLDEELLDDAGVYVPRAARPVPHVAKAVLGWKKPDKDAWQELATELEKVPANKTVALSHEGLWSEGKRALLQLRGLLRGTDLRIVLYLRDQADYLSWRVLDTQRHTKLRFDLDDRDALAAFMSKVQLDYLGAAQQFAKVFGPESVEVVPDTTGTRFDFDEVGDFYRRLGVDGPGPEASALRYEQMLTPGIAQALRKESAGDPAIRSRLMDVALRLSAQGVGVRPVLSPKEVRRLRRRHDVANTRLSELYLGGRRLEPAKPDTGITDHRDTAELRRLLREHHQSAPLLTDDWLQRPDPAVRPFADGWAFRELEPVVASPLVARSAATHATLRFRVPYELDGTASSGLELHLETEHYDSFLCDVRVNGEAVGTLDAVGELRIPLEAGQTSAGVYEIDLRPVGSAPLEVSALDLRDPAAVAP